MTDLATLGLAIDSRPATAASQALDQLAKSAKSAEDATKRLAASNPMKPAFDETATRAKLAADAVSQAHGAMQKAAEKTTATIIDFKKAAGDGAQLLLVLSYTAMQQPWLLVVAGQLSALHLGPATITAGGALSLGCSGELVPLTSSCMLGSV